MKKNRFAALCALLILTASVLFTGCESGGNGGTQNEANTSKNTTEAAATAADTKQESTDTSDDTSELFTERDLQQAADLTDAQTITGRGVLWSTREKVSRLTAQMPMPAVASL